MPALRLIDFGRPEEQDHVLTGPIIAGLIVATATSVSIAFSRIHDLIRDQERLVALVSGDVAILGFIFYLDAYYKHLWVPYFALPSDRFVFRFYALATILVLLVPMSFWPQYWYLYTAVLFGGLYWKKRRTRDLFERSFRESYPQVCDNEVDRARLELCRAFTRLWLRNGVGGNLLYSLLLMVLLHNDVYLRVQLSSWNLRISWFAVFSAIVVVISLDVWISKGSSGLRHMSKRIQAGDHEYFEYMDL